MLIIMLIMQRRLFVCRQRAIVLTAVSGRSAAGPRGPRVSQCFLLREKLHTREIYVSGGGLLMAPINEPHLLHIILAEL